MASTPAKDEACVLALLARALENAARSLAGEPDGAEEVLLHVGVPVLVRNIEA
jgi:hypothetical protein